MIPEEHCAYLIESLKGRESRRACVCAHCWTNRTRRVKMVDVDYTGFNIPDEFVVGYGLDYAQKYRNLPYIGVVEGLE